MKKFPNLIWILICVIPVPAFAVDVVRSPFVEQGEYQLDYKGKSQYDNSPQLNNIQEQDIGVGYSVTSYWRTRIESDFTDQHGQGIDYKYVGWANTVALTNKDSVLPTALFVNVVVANHAYISNYVTAGLAMLKNIGPITNTANLFLKHEYGDTASGRPSLLYRLQSKYNAYSYLEPGFELFGDTFKQNDFDNQTLKIGPGLFGHFQIGSERLGYELAYLVGATPASPGGTLQWRLSYTFR